MTLEQENGREIDGTFQVADVTRPLHSTSRICDNKHEILFTAGEATVVPEGSLSRFLGQVRAVAKYPRLGGLYVAKMKAKAPRKKSGFTRQGPKR